jgi:hypothetical protein
MTCKNGFDFAHHSVRENLRRKHAGKKEAAVSRLRRGSGVPRTTAATGPDLKTRSLPHSLAPTLVTLPSISRIPFARFHGFLINSFLESRVTGKLSFA